MSFIKASPGKPSKGKVKRFCTLRLRDNGNAQLTLSRGFVAAYFPGAKPEDYFSVQWGADEDLGKAMIARIDAGELRATDLRGALQITCTRPPSAPLINRPSALCRIISATKDAVLIELPAPPKQTR